MRVPTVTENVAQQHAQKRAPLRARTFGVRWGRFSRVTVASITDTSSTRRPWVLLFIAVCLVAANMRMTITGVGPLLEQIAADQGVPTATLGALGSTPLIAWAIFSPFAHWFSTRVGLSQAVSWSLVVLAAGTVWRSLPGASLNLWLGTALIGVGLAIANVLMPAAIKRDFPRRLALVMGAYSALLGGIGAVMTGLAVPISQITVDGEALGWRFALLISGALLPLALGVWMWSHRGARARVAAAFDGGSASPHSQTPPLPANAARTRGTARRIWGDPLAWLVSLYMGMQSIVFYVISTWFAPYETALGRSPAAAGLDLMVYQLFGIVGSMLLPLFLRGRWDRWMPAIVPAIGLIAWLGIPLVPALMPVWIVLGGTLSGSSLTMALTLMAQRARTENHASALSGMAQALGYAISAIGPIAFGWIHAFSGSWVLPFVVIWAGGAMQLVIGLAVGRPRFVLEADHPQADHPQR